MNLSQLLTHLHSQGCFLAQNQTIATNVRSFERLTHKLYDDMKHNTDKFQNLQKVDNLTKFRNGLRSL